MLKKILITIGALAVFAAVAVYGYFEAMKKGWIQYNEYDVRSEGMLAVGDLAPDLELAKVEGEESVRLSDLYRERPVVLAFGSYT